MLPQVLKKITCIIQTNMITENLSTIVSIVYTREYNLPLENRTI